MIPKPENNAAVALTLEVQTHVAKSVCILQDMKLKPCFSFDSLRNLMQKYMLLEETVVMMNKLVTEMQFLLCCLNVSWLPFG